MAGVRHEVYGYYNADILERSFLFRAESPTMLVILNVI